MPDLLSDQLSRLAPEVDMTASRSHFEARREGGVRSGSPTPRRTWMLAAAVVALLVAGVVGLVALRGGDTAITPQDQPSDSATTLPAPVAAGTEFELLLVEEASAPFHELFVAVDQAELDAAWEALAPPYPAPTVDFGRHVAAVLTRPDNACPDTLTRFDVDGSTWTPVFEVETGACNQPLLSWLYVVAIERSAVAPELTLSLVANEIYDAPARSVSAAVAPPTGAPTDPGEPQLGETGIRLPLPAVGQPALHATNLGFLWVVHHEDGTASVLPALVDLPMNEDEGGVSGIAGLVIRAEDGHTFGGPRWEWDAWGRTIGGPRTEDLVGFSAEVHGDEVSVLESDATTIVGEPIVPAGASRSYGTGIETLTAGLAMIDLEVYPTLSSVFPRLLDATLVVENGFGRICEIDRQPPVPDLETCGTGTVIDTMITSSQPDITTWYFGPLLAEFDTVGVASRVAAVGGLASRNDGIDSFDPVEIEVIIESAAVVCRADGTPAAFVELVAGADTAVNIEILGDGAVLGRGYAEPLDGQMTDVEIDLAAVPSGQWTVLVTTADHGGDELTSSSFPAPTDAGACT